MEIKPSFQPGEKNRVALLQICDGKTAVLIRLCSLRDEFFRFPGNGNKKYILPYVLVELLNSKYVRKVGVAVIDGSPGMKDSSVKAPGRERKLSRYFHLALSGCMTSAMVAVVGMSVSDLFSG